jgi:hypothetical protein
MGNVHNWKCDKLGSLEMDDKADWTDRVCVLAFHGQVRLDQWAMGMAEKMSPLNYFVRGFARDHERRRALPHWPIFVGH